MTYVTDDVFDLYRMGASALQAGQPRAAVAALESADAAAPGNPAVERLLGLAYYRFAALGRAERLLRRAVERDPADVEAIFTLGHTLLRRGRPREALPWLRMTAAMDPCPEHLRALHLAIGRALDKPLDLPDDAATDPEAPGAS